jgi:tripartite-type tricarboxylate transporter receptor subunit TctC
VQGKEVELGIRALARHLDAPFEPVLVRGGAEAMTQLLGGHVEASVGAGIQSQHVREGRVRELLNLADAPLALTPTAPTLRGLGLDLSVEPQFQIIGPPGMAPAAVAAIAALTEEWLALPESQGHLRERLLLVPRFQGPAETAAASRAEAITMRRLLAEFG